MEEPSTGLTGFPRSIGRVAARELAAHGYTTLEALADASERELLAIHGVGPKAVGILRHELAARGLNYRTLDSSS